MPANNNSKTFSQIRSKKKPVTETVRIIADAGDALRLEEARAAAIAARARANRAPTDKALQKAAGEAEDAADSLEADIDEAGGILSFTFKTLGRFGYEKLVAEHPPTKKQVEDAGQALAWDPDTFPPALLAACAVDPPMTEAEARELWEDEAWNQAECAALLEAAERVNRHTRTVTWGKGSGRTRSTP